MTLPAYDNKTWAEITCNYSSPSYWMTHTPVSGAISDVILICNPYITDLAEVTYGGQACVLNRRDEQSNVHWELWGLHNPPQGSQAVYARMSGSVSRNLSGWCISVTDGLGLSDRFIYSVSPTIYPAMLPYSWGANAQPSTLGNSLLFSMLNLGTMSTNVTTSNDTFIDNDHHYGGNDHQYYVSYQAPNGSKTLGWTAQSFTAIYETMRLRVFEMVGQGPKLSFAAEKV